MKITIDEKTCLKRKITVQEALLALVVRNLGSTLTLDGMLDNMTTREILVKDKDDYYVTQHWSDILDDILSDSSGTVEKSDEQLLELAKQMREIYPLGKMKNHYGQPTPYYYRCNNGEVVKKLKKFLSIYGDVSNEDILDATKRYVASFQGNYTNMRLIKYFILKDDVRPTEDGNHVEQISDLATFLENKGEEDDNNNDFWLMNSRN